MAEDSRSMERAKSFCKQATEVKLIQYCPAIIQVKCDNYCEFIEELDQSYSEIMVKAMQETMKCLCEKVTGCVLGYCQSGEISLALADYEEEEHEAWLDYSVQKMCSVAASIATTKFNEYFKNLDKSMVFSATVFNVLKEDVANYFYWRQLELAGNNGQLKASSKVSSVCFKSVDMVDRETQEKVDYGYPVDIFRLIEDLDNIEFKSYWVIDDDVPVFKGNIAENIEYKFRY